MIKISNTEDFCSCNNCHRPNYEHALGNMQTVDVLFDLQIGNHLVTICEDCKRELILALSKNNEV